MCESCVAFRERLTELADRGQIVLQPGRRDADRVNVLLPGRAATEARVFHAFLPAERHRNGSRSGEVCLLFQGRHDGCGPPPTNNFATVRREIARSAGRPFVPPGNEGTARVLEVGTIQPGQAGNAAESLVRACLAHFGAAPPPPPPPLPPPPARPQTLEDRIRAALEQFGQVLLTGPPGTGKTYLAGRVARSVTGHEDHITTVTCHPALHFEQFVGGLIATASGGAVAYQWQPGPLLDLLRRARDASKDRFVLVLDELNRGDVPQLLGGLLSLLEPGLSGRETRPPALIPDVVTGRPQRTRLPRNLCIIATMNTVDFSIGHLDAAVRRRFAEIPVGPDPEVVRRSWGADRAHGERFAAALNAINEELRSHSQGDLGEFGVGHWYLQRPDGNADLETVESKLRCFLLPLLRQFRRLNGRIPEDVLPRENEPPVDWADRVVRRRNTRA